MNQPDLLKQASKAVLAEQLIMLRGDLSQAIMAEKCAMSIRHYSDVERRIACVSEVTMLNLYTAGVDLNRWACDTLKRYETLCQRAGVGR